MKNLKETKTNFEKLAAMSDDDIDCSDIPELSKEFLASAKWMIETPEKEQITIRIDKSVLDFYRQTGRGYQTRMNAVLRAYAETEKRKQVRKQA
jgi:uncharacterized protein (DUF4415 family)